MPAEEITYRQGVESKLDAQMPLWLRTRAPRLSIVNIMAGYAQTKPIRNFSLILSAFVRPVHLVAASFNSAVLAGIRFSAHFRYPSVQPIVTDFVTLPIIVANSFVRVLLAELHSRPNRNATIFAFRSTPFPIPGFFTSSPRSWFAFIPCSLAEFRLKITSWRAMFSSSSFQARGLNKKLFSANKAYFFDAIKTSHFRYYTLTYAHGQILR